LIHHPRANRKDWRKGRTRRALAKRLDQRMVCAAMRAGAIARRALTAVAVGTSWTSIARAETAENEPRIRWTAPEECPSQAEIAGRTRQIVGRDARLRRPVEAEIVVSRRDAEWRADIQLDGNARTVQGESCGALAEAVALIVALAVERESALPAPPAPPPADGGPSPRPTPERSRASSFFVGASLSIGAGTLPNADVGPGIVAGFGTSGIWVGLDLGLSAKVDGRTAERPEEGASFWLTRGRLHACYTFFENAFRFGPCAGLEIDRIAADGFGSPEPKSTSALVPAASAGILALVRISSPFFLRAAVDGTAPFARPSFSVEGTGAVHKVAAIGLRGSAGVEVHF
jgi:hypothetical protein